MATLYITEYNQVGKDTREFPTYAPLEPALAESTITLSGSSQQSSDFNADTRIVRLVADAECHVAFASSPTATTSSQMIPANIPQFHSVTGGKLAVIQGA